MSMSGKGAVSECVGECRTQVWRWGCECGWGWVMEEEMNGRRGMKKWRKKCVKAIIWFRHNHAAYLYSTLLQCQILNCARKYSFFLAVSVGNRYAECIAQQCAMCIERIKTTQGSKEVKEEDGEAGLGLHECLCVCVHHLSACLSVCLLITEQSGVDSLAAGATSMVCIVSLCASRTLTLFFVVFI